MKFLVGKKKRIDYPTYILSLKIKRQDNCKHKMSQTSILLTGVQNEYKKIPPLHVIFIFLKRLLIESGRLKAKNVVQLL